MEHESGEAVTVTRADVERAAWTAAGWSRPQQVVDELLAAVDAYLWGVAGVEPPAERVPPTPPDVDPWEGVTSVALEPPTGVAETAEAGTAAEAVGTGASGQTARCAKCALVKPVTEFGRDSHARSGRRSRCKPCLAADRRAAKAGGGGRTRP